MSQTNHNDNKLELEASQWIQSVTNESFDSQKSFQQNLMDGTLLCKYSSFENPHILYYT